jgi:hypothetical protein
VAPPVGLTGTCGENLDDARPFQLALSGGGLTTNLDFSGVTQRLDEISSAVAFTYRPSRWSIQASVGMVIGGSLDGQLGNYRLQPGILGSVSVGYTFLDGTGALPFVAASFTAGVASASTYNEANASDRPQFTALDFRLSAVIGKRFFDFWLPYAGVAVFGGPVYFAPEGQSLTGTDEHHFRLSVGSSFTLPAHLEAFVEVGFLGEQNLLVGIGYAF